MNIPPKFEKILQKDQSLHGIVLDVVNDNSFGRILEDNKLFFFEEYTEHGIKHIEMVLKAAEFLIPDKSFEYIQPNEVAILILAVVLHDIGMHTEFSTFKAMIEGKYDDVRIDILDKKTWQDLWLDYLLEVRHWSSKKLEDVFGNAKEIIIDEPNLSDKDKLTGTNKKLIGEFLRKYHARLAHEIALKGFIGENGIQSIGNIKEQYKKYVGVVARSHGMNIRETFEYLKTIGSGKAWKNPENINIVYLMVLLRIADYLQIDIKRTNSVLLKLKTFNSPISLKEHETHLAIQNLNFDIEPELIYIESDKPVNAQMYVKIQTLIKDIQHELDLSWAILGEIYGFNPNDKPKIKFRRVDSNLDELGLEVDYVPQKISFQVNNELSKLLVAPLYGNNPTYGVRELVQNATDACKERIKIEQDKGNIHYEEQAKVEVTIDKIGEDKYLFKIVDNGKGMNEEEIINYYLNIGSSFRDSSDYKKFFLSKDGNIVNRSGRFGIGILATFILGNEITVCTKSYKDKYSYHFSMKIDDPHIDIKKELGGNIGTEISILINQSIYNKLIETGEKGIETNHCIRWNGWYVDNIPIVNYFVDKKKIEQYLLIYENVIVKEIDIKQFGKFKWFYNNHLNFSAHNGILLTIETGYNKLGFLCSSIIRNMPSLMIYDPKGEVQLKLDRSDIDWTQKLPFEIELIDSIAKDVIAHILTLPVSKEYTESTIKFDSGENAHIWYTTNGYTLGIDFFINKAVFNYRFVKIWKNSRITPTLYLSEKCLISYLLQDQSAIDQMLFAVGGLTLENKEDFYFCKRDNNIILQNDSFVLFNDIFPMQDEPIYLTKEWIEKFTNTKFLSNIKSIHETSNINIDTEKGGEILNQLFEKYIGDNIIIPYDMEERKKLYSLAFTELNDYMMDYEK